MPTRPARDQYANAHGYRHQQHQSERNQKTTHRLPPCYRHWPFLVNTRMRTGLQTPFWRGL